MYPENHIRKLSIKGFKSIRDLHEFSMNPLNILIGPNGAGKSNFVSYFNMLGEMMAGRLQLWTSRQGSADRILSFGVKETRQMESAIDFGGHGYGFALEPTLDGSFSFADERLFQKTSDRRTVSKSMGTGHQEAKIRGLVKPLKKGVEGRDDALGIISGWKVYHFHDTSDTASVKREGSLHDNRHLRSDASNLAAFLYRMAHEHPDIYGHNLEIIRLAIPFFDNFDLKPRKLSTEEEMIRLLWRQNGSDYGLWPSQLSDGSIRFICLVTALMQPEPPPTIIIDEPELGLHPAAITLLGGLIRTASKRMQVIVSTQSVPLVNEFAIDDLIIVERKEDATLFSRPDPEEFGIWLEEYSVGELWAKNVLGGRPL